MASGPISNVGSLSQALATALHGNNKPEFELQFNQLQNTVIERLNKEIEKVNAAGGSKAEVLEMQREGRTLGENLPVVEKFLFDTQTNLGRLNTISTQVASMIGLFTDDANISATDLTAFNTARTEIVAELNKMQQLTYTGYTDGNIIQRLKNEIATLEALAPVEGIVDPAGTAVPTNVNRDVQTALETFQTQVTTAQDVTLNTTYGIVDIRQDMITSMSVIQANITEINTSVQLRKAAEVDALKEKYGHLLNSISLSYEVSSGIADNLNKHLAKIQPEKGSVLNMFT